jgi:acyl carrier protein
MKRYEDATAYGGPAPGAGGRLSPEGWREVVEGRLRAMVAKTLGVHEDRIEPGSRLAGDLGARPVDVLEVAGAAETEFGIELADDSLDVLRTYGDLVEIVCARLAARDRGLFLAEGNWVRARLAPADGDRRWEIVRVVAFTEYAADTIADDARHAGPGSKLEVEVSESAPSFAVAALAARLACLAPRGVHVDVHRGPGGPSAAADGTPGITAPSST